MHGFHGQYWRFDLGTGRGDRLPIPETVLRRYLGGVGLGTWLLHREAPPGVDPLAPEAPLIFSFAPLVGTQLTTTAKLAVVAKSPLTGFISDSLSSSHFAIAGKQLGVDAIVLVGACDEPSELVNGRLRPTALWGASAAQAQRALSAEGRVAAIGVAGENGVRYATISNDGRHAGRGGLGSVMGSKKLKAIVVSGNRPTSVADPSLVSALAKDLSRRSLGPATAKYRDLGTAANLAVFDRIAALPTRNFQASQSEQASSLSLDETWPQEQRTRVACARCTIGCTHLYSPVSRKEPAACAGESVDTAEVADRKRSPGVRVEYESLFALGSLCGVFDPDSVLAAIRLCDELGLDTISAGGTIAFAMECGERGLLPEAPPFGDAAGLQGLLGDIAHRRGLGALLAEGSRRAALRLGEGAIGFAAQVKGLEIPGYDPRALQTMALGFAVGTRGADHNKSGAYELDFSERVDRLHGDERSAALAVETENRAALTDSLILCKFVRGVFRDLYKETAELLAAVTGWDFDAAELERTAARIVALRKAFNIREGWQPSDDTLPGRFFEDALPSGASKGARLEPEQLAAMVRSYNRTRGWTDEGYLPAATLRELGTDLGADLAQAPVLSAGPGLQGASIAPDRVRAAPAPAAAGGRSRASPTQAGVKS